MTCMDCGAAVKVRHNQTVAYDFGGLPDVSLKGIDVRVCANGHQEYVILGIEGLHKAIAFALARKDSRLIPTEIKFMRKYLGFSQVDLAQRMGVTPESVSRWESGSIMMAPTAERLLRLAVLSIDPVPDYRALDLFAKLKSKRAPAKMRLTRRANKWQAAAA